MKSMLAVSCLFFYLEERRTKNVPSWKRMVLQKFLILKEKERRALIALMRIDDVLMVHRK